MRPDILVMFGLLGLLSSSAYALGMRGSAMNEDLALAYDVRRN